jgi:hypothetical protein
LHQAEGVRPGFGLGEGVRAHQVGRETGEVPLLLRVARGPEERLDDQGVLDVHEHGRGGVHRRQRLHGERRHEQPAARAAVPVRDLDPHQAQLEQLGDEGAVELRRLVHRHDAGTDLLFGELAHRVPEHLLFFRELRERGRTRGRRHGAPAQLFFSPLVSRSLIPPSDESTPVAS